MGLRLGEVGEERRVGPGGKGVIFGPAVELSGRAASVKGGVDTSGPAEDFPSN
jgi:hypothetical protein